MSSALFTVDELHGVIDENHPPVYGTIDGVPGIYGSISAPSQISGVIGEYDPPQQTISQTVVPPLVVPLTSSFSASVSLAGTDAISIWSTES